jgi:hypothetical protein
VNKSDKFNRFNTTGSAAMTKKLDWKKIKTTASEAVMAEQNASYAFLSEKLGGLSWTSVWKLLKFLEAKGLVRQGEDRHWVVIVNRDGSRKNPNEIPPERQLTSLDEETPHEGHTAITKQVKIDLLTSLSTMAGQQKALVLKAIMEDVADASTARTILTVLKD